MTFPLTLIFIWLVFWRPQEWLFPWMFGWPLLNAIFYMALVGLLAEAGQGAIKFPKTPAVGLAVGLWIASLTSHMAHGYFQGLLNTYQETLKICVFLVLLLVVVNSISRLRWVISVLLMGAVLMAIHSVLQARTGVGFSGLEPIRFYYEFKDRWVQQSLFFGLFSDPNDLGQFLATCIPLVFALPKRLGFVALVISVAVVWLLGEGLLATQSRGTFIGVVASVACMLFMALPVKWMPYVAGVALIGGLAVCVLGGGGLLDSSARDRVVFWGYANQYFKSHPLFGGGYGMFGEITGTDRAAHNAYVCCYSELGFFGYWFWFNMLTLGVIGCWRTRVAFSKPKNVAQAYLKRAAGLCIASISGFAASSYFLTRAYVFPLFFLFGILASIPMIAKKYLPEDHPPLVDFHKDVLLLGTVASIASILYIYMSILFLNRAYGG
jgi:hypothetical protein